MLRLRILSAVVAIPLLIVITILGDVWFLFAVLVAGLWALCEWCNLLERGGHRPFFAITLVSATAVIVAAYYGARYEAAVIALTALAALAGVSLRREPGDSIGDWSLTLGGVVYCGLFLSYFVLLRGLEHGAAWVLVVLFGTFSCDTAAFFVGRRFGRRKLAPNVSPAKTVEGAIAGLVGSIFAYLILTIGFGVLVDWLQAALLGLMAGIATQLGDLAESSFKRSLRAKDAGATIPGHGGMLDRIDSLVFAGVVVYYFNELLRVA